MMRRALLQMTSLALLCLPMAITAAAQTPKADPSMTTIVGCLVQENPSSAVPAERRSETGAANANDYFVRTPTVAMPVGASVAVGKPGTASTSTSAGTPAADSLYRITGLDRAQLRPHVGHKVEVQGHLSPVKPDASASGVTSTRTTVDANGKPTVRVETAVSVVGNLHTSAIKMVSATCP